ncbi:uncharacterized protein LOC9656317 [Selaginella moellendorffii]|uniref:uncharacterized protein LOC9656317 n=1 Tax=Selaginella moellendorffii TaxID=88036 RepID=UPI000D1CF11A|nr:uncharacterized protein LOC9656317 [Selaginella moellendorffii]|eukprot:XP_002980558.2 uncharacterized protein LOC9656317 [Selaginella moellendorffii]
MATSLVSSQFAGALVERGWSGRIRSKRFSGIVAASRPGDFESDGELITKRLKDLSDSLLLPRDFLKSLPRDLQVDVNDAAFALSRGPVHQECGSQVGELLQRLSKAWERSDTDSVGEIGKAFTGLEGAISKSGNGPAFGRRLIRAGNYFKSTGQYAQGEFQDIAKALLALGEAVGGREAPETDISTMPRVLKFGTLQVAITPGKAFTGAAIALVFGFLSWQLAAAVKNIPESSLSYANDNALMVAASLRGTLLAMAYSCAGLSAFSTVGLLVLGFQAKNKE